MSRLIKIEQAVVVEGKYDKIRLENIIDATIITTNGFGIFKDREKCRLLRILAEKKGIVVLTDSDSAGMLIRSYLKQICPENTITNVYIPQLRGKEKRKTKPSKEGYLGVEGISDQVICEAFRRSGITPEDDGRISVKKITKTDLFAIGLSGGNNSRFLRSSLAQFLELPTNISANAFLDAVNAIYSYDEFLKAVELWQQDADKR